MTREISRLVAPAAMLGASLMTASAAEPARNFVYPDMTWHKVDPPVPGYQPPNVVLVDTESARKSGDMVQFDELFLKNKPSYEASAPSPHKPESNVQLQLAHFEVSCGWRTMRRLPAWGGEPAELPSFTFWLTEPNQTGFLPANGSDHAFVDKLCTGLPLNAAKGARSIAQAISFLKDSLPSPVNTITTQSIVGGPRYPLPPMDPGHVHRFVETQTSDASGNALYLDRAKMTHDGDSVTALSLVVLGPAVAQSRMNYGPVIALRKTRYDCTGQSLTVIAQGLWNRYGEFMGGSGGAFGQRFAAESTVTAADIKAACSDEAPGAQSFAMIEDAWAAAQTNWPPLEPPAWQACLWNGLPEQVRTQYLADLSSYSQQTVSNAKVTAPQVPLPEPSAIGACAPPNAQTVGFAIAAYALQRGALAMLSAQHIDEPKLRAAWNSVPWLERQQFARSVQSAATTGLQLRSDMIDKTAKYLGIAASDAGPRAQLENYLVGEARLEGY
jgi:hypothetical protein